ncbi:RTA1 like protein, partial [Aspergillus bombycis]
MPLARRSHRKTRTGCPNCKRRRIKCDEQKPSCRNCVQHRIECEYAGSQAMNDHSSLASATATPSPSPSNIGTTRTLPPNPWAQSGSSLQPQPSVSDDDVLNSRLIHHYSTATYQTLSDKAEFHYIWQFEIPEIAFEHRFLLPMIRAVSALHICRKGSSEVRYKAYAYQQYEASLKDSSLALSRISPSNCHALYAVSALAFVFELGTSYNHDSLLCSGTDVLAPWIVHIQGVRTIMLSTWAHIKAGVLGALFDGEPLGNGPVELESCVNDFAGYIETMPLASEQIMTYRSAANELIKWSKMPYSGFFGWVCLFGDDPSVAAAVIALICYGASTGFHIFQLWKLRSWFFTTFVVGAIMMTVGYIFRTASAKDKTAIGPYIGQNVCILLPPSLYAATIYMIYSRIVLFARSHELSIIAPHKVTKIFVIGDVIAFLMQATGGGMMAISSMSSLGQKVTIVGLFVQLIFFGGFFTLSVVFHQRVQKLKRTRVLSMPYGPLLYVLFGVSLLIIIRCLFRIVEFCQGNDGYLASHEVF